jgi:hypothetical protein
MRLERTVIPSKVFKDLRGLIDESRNMQKCSYCIIVSDFYKKYANIPRYVCIFRIFHSPGLSVMATARLKIK